jgi:hypothetical protein
MNAHYLNLASPVEWEHIEIAGGKQRRARFAVPRLLDPRDPGDWNSRWGQRNSGNMVGNEDGEIHVCLPGQGEPSDYEFLGDPTPDMMPIDDEAREISARFSDRWSYRPEEAEVGFSQSLVDGFKEAMEASRQPETVKIEGLTELMAMMAQSQKMIAEALSAQHSPRRA